MPSIWLAGEDRSADLLPRLEQAVKGRDPGVQAQALRHSAIASLKDLADDKSELDQWLALLRADGLIRTDPFEIPARSGFLGRAMKRLKQALWKLLRYQHDRMAFQQNDTNTQVFLALEAILHEQRREIHVLRERVAALEAKLKDLEV